MILTIEAQIKIINEYDKDKSIIQVQAFAEGMNALIEYINKQKANELHISKTDGSNS